MQDLLITGEFRTVFENGTRNVFVRKPTSYHHDIDDEWQVQMYKRSVPSSGTVKHVTCSNEHEVLLDTFVDSFLSMLDQNPEVTQEKIFHAA